MQTYMHAYRNTYTDPYIGTCRHACMHAYIHTYRHTHIPTYLNMYLQPTCMHSSIPPSINPYIHPSIHPSIHPYVHTTHTQNGQGVTFINDYVFICTPSGVLVSMYMHTFVYACTNIATRTYVNIHLFRSRFLHPGLRRLCMHSLCVLSLPQHAVQHSLTGSDLRQKTRGSLLVTIKAPKIRVLAYGSGHKPAKTWSLSPASEARLAEASNSST